jgi:subtilisin family serine protease
VARRLVFLVAASGTLAVTGCGGGGATGGSVPHPTPTATSTGVPTQSCAGGVPIDGLFRRPFGQRQPHAATPSVYTFASNPSGLAVTINGSGSGTTQKSTTPSYANEPSIGSIKGPSANFSVCYAQLADGNHTIYYNTASDTSGTIGAIASTPAVREGSRPPSFARLVRRFPHARIETGVDAQRIQVHFVTAAIRGDARRAAVLEHALGAPNAYTLGAVNTTMDRIVSIPKGETPQEFAAKFQGHAEVADARPLPLRYTQSSVTPNDQFFDNINQWDFYRIDTLDAWGITEGTAPIAIVDTGADLTAKDLAAQITYEVKWVAQEPPYPNFAAGAAQDMDGHGTNVSGIADAITNNLYGFAGVGFNAPLQIYRIFPTPTAPNYSSDPSYGASVADEARAVDDAVAHGAKVINLSLGSCAGANQPPGPDPTEFAAIEGAIAAGVVVVAAAGNERSGGGGGPCEKANTIDFPAAYPGVIAVGATSLHDNNTGNPNTATEYVAGYSNSGPGLAVVAPGGDPSSGNDQDSLHWITNLYSSTVADPKEKCQPVQGTNPPLCAALFAGTSQATPHVTGTVALMRSAAPNLAPAQIKSIIENTTDNISDPNQGFGRLNTFRAVAAAAGVTTGLPTPSAINFRAIAYTVTKGSNRPNVLNATFPSGVPLDGSGNFRVADVPAGSPGFRIGLWYDANGNGIVDNGDYFGSAGPCTANAPCTAAATIGVNLVGKGFVLK